MEQHPGSLDTYLALSTGRDGLDRYRIFEDLGQYLLNGVKGDILEIGVGESSHFLSKIGAKFNRRIYHCDISPSKIVNPMTVPGYLSPADEITYFEERDPVPAELKRVVCFAGSSDALFEKVKPTALALTFIDGDHRCEQARKDFWNAYDLTVPNGYILMHDTYPPDESWTDENRCGDVYKLRQELEGRRDMDILTLTDGCCIGVGLTIVRKRDRTRTL